MSNRSAGESRPNSGLALLAAGTMLLAAAGETLHHAHASAFAGGGGAASAPGAATPVLTAEPVSTAEDAEAAVAEAAAETEEEAATMTTPLFKPFVFVELPLPDGYTLVEGAGVHMNDDGVCVATMNDGDDNYGFIWYDELYADGWQGPIEADSTPIILDDAGLAEINDELEICGTRINSGAKAFFLALTDVYEGTLTQIGSGYAQDLNNLGIVVGTAVGGGPVGWWDIVGSPFPLPALPGGSATAANGLTPNTNLSSSLIVGQSKDSGGKYQAVVWYSDGGWQAVDLTGITGSNVGFAIDVNEYGVIIGGVLTSGSISDTITWYYDVGQEEWVGVSLDVSSLFIPEAINDEDYPEIVGGQYLWVSGNVAAGTGAQLDMASMSLGVPENLINMRLTDLSNAGEIVGVGQLGSEGEWIAFKLVPYDVNNNGEPDFREIVASDFDLDANGNWLLDWAEEMRCGLHAPGHPEDDSTGAIASVQVVRHRIGIKQREGVGLGEGEELIYIDEVLSPAENCTACLNFTDLMNQWGTGSYNQTDPRQSETLVWVRSLLEEDIPDWGNHDALPANASDRAEALEDIRDFAYRFAHCIDWLQWGNEVFGGAGEYKFRNSDLSCTIDDGTRFRDLPTNACKVEAVEKVLEWIEAQMQAAREGSALAGRPIRKIGPGMLPGHVRNGYVAGNDPDPPNHPSYIAWVIIDKTTALCNRHNMYLSMHVHYETVAQAQQSIEKLVGGGSWTSPPWDVPEFKVATEWGPKADFTTDQWWLANQGENVIKYQRFFYGSTDPGESWDSFVGRWEDESNSFGDPTPPGFRLDAVLGWFDGAGFTAVCYGPSLQHDPGGDPGVPNAFNVAALCTNEVNEDWEEPYFSALRTRYQNAVSNGGFVITPFEPHEEPVPTSETCPDCGG